jgi:twitching motility protein PilT
MLTTPAIENHIRKTETFKIPSVIQTSKAQGMLLLDDSLLKLHNSGRIDKHTRSSTRSTRRCSKRASVGEPDR